MQSDKIDLSERLLDFAARIIELTQNLEKTYTGKHIAGQLMRAATSAGANYEEARAAESRSYFIHKMQLALKELRESLYWLRLIERSNIGFSRSDILNATLKEADELVSIITKSVITAKKNQ